MIQLRPYQAEAIDALREGIRNGHRKQLLVSPTGSGKTEIAMALVQEAEKKFSRTAFIVDRVSLCDQTAQRYEANGIAHGVIQANHWNWKPYERHQICSVQTLARRGMAEGTSLLIVDEAHTMYRMTTEFLKKHDVITVGLTATPFAKGLGQIFTNVVNVTTTDQLIAENYLVPIKAYAGKAADMTGAKTKFDGEWQDAEMESRGLTIIGDVVSEWIAKTNQHFDRPVKTIVFSATVAHGEELCKRFQDAGFNFQQVSYKDGNDDKRRALIEEFRQPNSQIMGLVSCEALAKGFDVPDILCGISCRPYRKSLSGHIQQLGRVMRPYPGKSFALWLDHSGNFVRFMEDSREVFARGVVDLSDKGYDSKIRKEPTEGEKTAFMCAACKFLMGGASHCPSCGWERPKTRSDVREIAGELHEVTLDGKASKLPAWATDKEAVWRQLTQHALERKKGDIDAAKRFAYAQYRGIYGSYPRRQFDIANIEAPDPRLVSKVRSMLIAYANRRAA